MDEISAKKIHDLALKAITNLHEILSVTDKYEDYETVKKAVGLSIGRIQTDILETIYKSHPELDDLINTKN